MSRYLPDTPRANAALGYPGGGMGTMPSIDPVTLREIRGESREVAIIVRMSRADRQRLRDTADELGITVQELFELRMLGYDQPVPTEPRVSSSRGRRRQSEELPLTG